MVNSELRMKKAAFYRIMVTLFMIGMLYMPLNVRLVTGWSNGGYSTDPSQPVYGTHDWIAQHALDWLPTQEKKYVLDNLAAYLYGTELPDNGGAPDGIGDTTKHHIYYNSAEVLTDDAAAVRASAEYSNTLSFLEAKDYVKAAKNAGIMSHYIADMAVFGHVMGSSTDWGAEVHHSDYEEYVNERTSSYSAEFNSYLSFDGNLTTISAYDATKVLAYDTTFDVDGDLTCVWMDRNYNSSNPTFRNRAGESLNLAVNLIADVLHTLYDQAQTSQLTTAHIVINEVEQNPPGTDAGHEWVELYNPTANSVDISGWTVSTTAGVTVTLTIPSGTRIQPSGYCVLTYGSQWLDNEGESVILRDSGSNEVDRTFSLSDTYNDDRSWQRYPNGLDTNSTSDWIFQWSTMGVSNGGEAVEKKPTSISCVLSRSTITKGETVTISGAINVTVSAMVTIQVSTDGGATWSDIATIASASDGRYSYTWTPSVAGTYRIRSTWSGDATYLGATSPIVILTVNEPVMDKTPPTTHDNYDGIWHTTDFTITLNATDNESGVAETYYSLNTETAIRSVSVNGQPRITMEGANNTLTFWSIDKAGNEETHRFLSGIKLDKTPPTGSLVINNNATYTTSASVTLNATGIDSLSGVYQIRYSNDGVWDTEAWEAYLASKTWALITGDGTKTVYYQIKDNAGLVSSTYSDTIILDTTPPTGSITVARGAVYTNSTLVTLTLSAEDVSSDVVQIRFSNDNTTWTPWEAYSALKNWTLTAGDSVKTVYVQFMDRVRLISQTYSASIILDMTAPTVTITSPTSGSEVKSSSVTVTWTASDETSEIGGYEVRIDSGAWTSVGTATSREFTGLSEGSHTVDVRATDKAGNVKLVSVGFTVNTSSWLLPAAAICGVAIVAVAAFLFLRRSRSERKE